MPFVTTQVHTEGTICEIKSDREEQISNDLPYTWNLKTKAKQKNPKLTDRKNRLVTARGRGWGVGKWAKGIKGGNFQL